MKTRPSIPALLRLAASALFCLLLVSSAAAQCTTATTPVSGQFAGGGAGSAPMTQRMTATGAVSGGNLVVSVTYDIIPNAGAGSVAQLQVAFGAGFTGTVNTSTSANDITYSDGVYSPSPFVQIPTFGLSGGAMRAQGTVTIPLNGGIVTNGSLTLRPFINGSFQPNFGGAARFNVLNNTFAVPVNAAPSEGVCVTGTQQCQSITSFTASPSAVGSGGSTTLSWAAANASSVDIVDLATGAAIASGLPANGSLVVTPASTRSYRLRANGACAIPTADVGVTVCPSASASSFTSSPSSINPGGSSTLSWNVPNAAGVTIAGVGSFGPSGSVTVSPSSTTTYTLTAGGDAGCSDVTLQAAVAVNPPPTISAFWVNPNPICAGAATTLGWDTGGATDVSITDLATGAVTSGLATSGTLNVTPPSSRTYRLTASNGAGSVTQEVSVTVNPLAVINGLSASASTINAGQSTDLNFNVSNSTARSITDLTTNVVTNLGVEVGSLTVTPPTSRTYRLTASNGCNTVTQEITITVIQPPSISSFAAAASPVCAGGTSTLSWSAAGGTSATISAPGLPGSPVSVNPSSGSLVVNPTTSTTYTLTVSNSAGSVTATATVNVTPAPSIGSFSASPAAVNAGQSSTLSWASTNGTSASVTDLASGSVTPVPVNGSLTVTPPSTRTYRLTVSGACGTVSGEVTITVTQAPVITAFSASASPVCSGGASTLSWTASGGTSASISAPGLPGSPVSVNPSSGTLVVNPAATTTYTLTVANSAGSDARTVTVTVTPAPSVASFTASATTLNAGASTTLSFTSTNGTSASVTDLTTNAVTSVPVNGSLVVTPPTTRTYRFTVTGSCGTDTLDLTITVIQSPVINSFSASASPVCAGGASTLSWSATGGTSATISAPGLPGSPVSVNPSGGTLVVNPAATTTYTLTVTNSAGSVTAAAAVTVTPAPSVGTFAATPSTLNAGQSTSLAWTSSSGTSATVTDLATGAVTNVAVNGNLTVTPATSRSYRLTVTGSCGTDTREVAVTVTEAPAISSFTATSPICSGASSTLSWASAGGTSASITDLATNAVTSVPVNGSLVVTPATSRSYRLTVTNAAGSTPRDVAVTVNPLAVVNSFTATASTVNAGQSTNLNFNVSNSTARSITDLATGAVTNLAAESGTLSVTPPTSRTYRLTASNGCNTVTSEVTITVNGPPSISAFAASAPSVCSGGASTLSWSATGGTSASVSAPGLPGSPVSVNPNSGTLVVNPAATTTYTLTVTNAAGSDTRTVTVAVTPAPSIASFTATPAAFVQGDSSTLAWTSSGGTSATITDLTTNAVTNVAVNGSLSVTPASTRSYRLTVTGSCGTATRDVTVTVTPCQTIASFTASAPTVGTGESTTLSYSLAGATSATITDLATGAVTNVPVQSGTLTVTPATTRTYRLSAVGPCATATRDITITVTNCQVINSFSASPTAITLGNSVTLSWNITGATESLIVDGQTGQQFPVVPASGTGSITVTPAVKSPAYIYVLYARGPCEQVNQPVYVLVGSGVPMIGPRGQPLAVGPTDNNDDYTNMTATSGVAAPFGGLTTAGGVLTFTNSTLNNGPVSESMTLTARVVPAGFTVEATLDGGATWTNIGTGSVSGTLAPGEDFNVPVRVTYPAGLNVLTGHSIVLRLALASDPAAFNETINRLWTGFIRVDKSQTVINSTGVGPADAAVKGAVIRYSLNYSNVTPAATGTGNVELYATNLTLTEDGNAAPNNWATTTDHVPGQATDTRGGTITGDTAGSSLIVDVVPRLDPAQSGVFSYARRIK